MDDSRVSRNFCFIYRPYSLICRVKITLSVTPIYLHFRESVKSGHHCCPCQAPPPPVLVTTSPTSRIIRQSSQPEASACCCSGCCCPLHTSTTPSAASLRQLREPGDGIAGIAADSLRINGGIRQFRQVSTPTSSLRIKQKGSAVHPPAIIHLLARLTRARAYHPNVFTHWPSSWIARHPYPIHFCVRLSCFRVARGKTWMPISLGDCFKAESIVVRIFAWIWNIVLGLVVRKDVDFEDRFVEGGF